MRTLLLIVMAVAIGCAPTIKRSGYVKSDARYNANECNPTIVKNKNFTSPGYKRIGEIKIDDSGFSLNCEESNVLEIMKAEACKNGADVINIVKEKRADLISTCYRVTAELIKIENRDSIATTDAVQTENTGEYSNVAVESRVQDDKSRKMLLNILGFGLGFAFGFFLLGNL